MVKVLISFFFFFFCKKKGHVSAYSALPTLVLNNCVLICSKNRIPDKGTFHVMIKGSLSGELMNFLFGLPSQWKSIPKRKNLLPSIIINLIWISDRVTLTESL